MKGFEFKDLLRFDVMVFPKVATVLYLLLVAIAVLFGFATVIRGMSMPWGGGTMIVSGLLLIVIGPFFIRLWFEALLVFFKVYDRLRDINNKLDKLPELSDTTRM